MMSLTNIDVKHYHALYEGMPREEARVINSAFDACREQLTFANVITRGDDPAEELIAAIVAYVERSKEASHA
jgi:hypothetical protein